MTDAPEPPPVVDAPEAKAQAQTGPPREEQPPAVPEDRSPEACRPDGFVIADRVLAAALTRPHARQRGEPLYRQLRIYALDPAASRLDGAVAALEVPYEPLTRGPAGALFTVVDFDETRQRHYDAVDLEAPFVLMQDGCTPAVADPHFHQQMVYAVASRVYFSFKLALGRDLSWGFGLPTRRRLRIRPHAFDGRNAYYDRTAGELAFGYFRANEAVEGTNLPRGLVFTCLSHDIVAHEMTHALLDGLRANFMVATGPDVLAFHEALADLVAVFLHFQYPEVVKSALQRSHGDLRMPSVLSDLAPQFGQTTGAGRALRRAIEEMQPGAKPVLYDRTLESHALGGLLVAAVYEAFVTVFNRKVARAVRLATSGTGILPAGAIDPDLLDELAESAKKLAKQFLTICIRAIDYCPSVDIEFGEYLRAMITADADLVPDDPWAYREALIDAFRRRAIYPGGVQSLSEDSLRWQSPFPPMPPIRELHFAELRFAGDPATASSEDELRRQACVLGRAMVKDSDSLQSFGLARPDAAAGVEEPRVESVRTLRRIGPDNQVVFDLVAEITQRRLVASPGGPPFPFLGGATVIVGPEGNVRHVIFKRAMNERRLEEQRRFMAGAGQKYWKRVDETWAPAPAPFALLHQHRP